MLNETELELFNLEDLIHDYIDEELKLKVIFREHLIIGKFEGKGRDHDGAPPGPVGGMCLDVQASQGDKLIVYASTKFSVHNVDTFGGSKITTWTDAEFRTIEEKRVEYIGGKEKEKRETQSLYAGIQDGYIFVRHKRSDGTDKKRIYPLAVVPKLICEGANFLLMRLLALHKYTGQFETSTFYITGDLCKSIYKCTGPESGLVNNVKTDVCKVYRVVIEECGLTHESVTVLTSHGHIVNNEWKGCAHVLYTNPLNDECTTAPMPLALTWQTDMEMFSEFLDRKQMCFNEATVYVEDTPELSDILADYIKTLLQHKPSRVLDFTADYFVRYLKEFS